MNTLHRLKDMFLLNGSTTIQSDDVTEQYKLACDALLEEKKFITYFNLDNWPEDMEVVRNNLLRTTCMDDEIMVNRGNELSILECLYSAMKRYYPELVSIQEQARDQHSLSKNNVNHVNEEPPSSPTNNEGKQGSNASEETESRSNSTHIFPSLADIEKKDIEEDIVRLRSKGIECHNMK